MKRILLTLTAVVAMVGGLARPLRAAENVKAAAKEDPLAMTPFEVSAESVEFRSWIKLSSPHYILYTDAKEKEAMNTLRELEKVQLVAQGFFKRRVLNLPPVVLVLPTSGSDWRKIESKGGVEWKVAVSQQGGLFSDIVLVEYDWQSTGLWIVRAAQGRTLVEGMNLSGPFWFLRGIGQFFETVEVSDGKVTLGRQNPQSLSVMNDGWIDWARFFALTPGSQEFRKEATVGKVEGQAAVFMHYMLANPDAVWVDRLLDWTERLRAGRAPTEAEFKTVFGQDWKAWQKTMDDYMRNGRYTLKTLQLPKAILDFPIARLDLPVREMRELFILAQIMNQRVPASEAALDAILRKGLKSEPLREMLAEACFERGRIDEAHEQLRLLQAAPSRNPRVYAKAAQLAFDHSVSPISMHARLAAKEAEELRALCGKVLQLEPLHVQTLQVLAWTEALGPEVSETNIAAIEKIYRVMQGHTATSDAVAALGVAAYRVGDRAWAKKIAQALADSPYADRDGKRVSGELFGALGEIAVPTPAPVVPLGKP